MTAPCRSLQYAHDQTSIGGSINVLSSGDFTSLTITKSISVLADGVEALIGPGSVIAAITVNGPADTVVFLRGLTIQAPSVIGISFVAGAALHVQNSLIRRSSIGIKFAPAAGNSELYVSDSVIANASSTGIFVGPSGSGNAKVVFERLRVENGSSRGIEFSGIPTTGSITATVRDSVSAGNATTGILVQDNGGGTTTVMIDRSASVNNAGTGVFAIGTGATIRMGDSTVSGNSIGLNAASSGVLASYGNNRVNGNVNGDGVTPTSVLHK